MPSTFCPRRKTFDGTLPPLLANRAVVGGRSVTALDGLHPSIASELAQHLEMKRPLAFIDLETTGTNVNADRIVEVAVLKLFPNGTTDIRSRRVKPGIPIPMEATAVHGITDEDVRDCPEFSAIAHGFSEFIADCDFAGFNVAGFDLKVLEAEFLRVGIRFSWRDRSVVDAMKIFFNREPRDLSGALRFYCGREYAAAHGAKSDVLATLEVLAGQFRRYGDLPTSLEELTELADIRNPNWIDPDGRMTWVDGVVCVGFGKHKGRSLADVLANEADYLGWMLSKDFSPEVNAIIRSVRAGVFPVRDPAERAPR